MAESGLKMTDMKGTFAVIRVSLARREKAVRKGRTAQVVMTGLANCSSLL